MCLGSVFEQILDRHSIQYSTIYSDEVVDVHGPHVISMHSLLISMHLLHCRQLVLQDYSHIFDFRAFHAVQAFDRLGRFERGRLRLKGSSGWKDGTTRKDLQLAV